MAPNDATTEVAPNADEVSLVQAAKDHPDVERSAVTTWAEKSDEFATEYMPDVSVRILADELPDDLQAIAETHKMNHVGTDDEPDEDFTPLYRFVHEQRD